MVAAVAGPRAVAGTVAAAAAWVHVGGDGGDVACGISGGGDCCGGERGRMRGKRRQKDRWGRSWTPR